MAESNGHGPDSQATRKLPVRASSTTKVNVAFPFSRVTVHEPSDELAALAALVADLATLVAGTAPGPDADRLARRAHELSARLR